MILESKLVSKKQVKMGVSYIDLIVLHVTQSQQLIEVPAVEHDGMLSHVLLIQGIDEGIGLLNGNLLCPYQTLKSTKNCVGCLRKAF